MLGESSATASQRRPVGTYKQKWTQRCLPEVTPESERHLTRASTREMGFYVWHAKGKASTAVDACQRNPRCGTGVLRTIE